MKLRLGTRGSDLATTQSGHVAAALAEAGIEAELVIITTSGDRSDASSFSAIGPQGVFVREIEQALIAGEVDFAVHSFKDLPTASPEGLVIGAVPTRRDEADWLFRNRDRKRGQSPFSSGKRALTPFSGLAEGARVGTASARRQAWLRHFRPDLEIVPLRGNVPTRLKRLVDGDYDAILLAGAGVERLAEASHLLDDALAAIEQLRLDPAAFVPAPAQGALAVQCRAGDTAIREALATIDDSATRAAVTLERTALALAEGGCDTAFGAFASPAADGFRLLVMLERAGRVLAAEAAGAADDGLAERAMAALEAAAGSAT
jgi:hydroxymethylbilane synthase